MSRTLFVIDDLATAELHAPDVWEGKVGMSCSRSSFLLVLKALSELDEFVAVTILRGDRLTGSPVLVVNSLDEALEWVGAGRVVYCSWGNSDGLKQLVGRGVTPYVWLHTYLDRHHLVALDAGDLEAVIVPSDTARVHALRRRCVRRVARMYNPIHPIFIEIPRRSDASYASKRVVFAGAVNEHKGAHRVLQLWPRVRDSAPGSQLVVAGSPRLYDSNAGLGAFGVALPEFEARYVQPLVDRYGSLDEAGVEFAGLLTPLELRELYSHSALGLCNLNWSTDAETFGCAVVEMVAAGLPVVGVARGALPETAGQTGAATLLNSPDEATIAHAVTELLNDTQALRALGMRGREQALRLYGGDTIASDWRKLLNSPPEKVGIVAGSWRNKNRRRAAVESVAGYFGLGKLLDRIEDMRNGI
ncbi:glycosyltransferase family 4 protein [Botrimarina mediterranea]|uniref:Spore coat protein SA n=1 Tax=Botrimarina mediterranea TaxID=2528022 RepID=A0A518KBE3_9BACT|nr:glycosyltransferase [Botrimarina mediterranea]QDV75110.1 Spore coat protein SA [Botrimarina mediterranea]QDV79755.1 Spore coat protein SA [Planctomycetes bacterium K2D]